MSERRGKRSGWAAFGELQKQKDSLKAGSSNEPFPSLPGSLQWGNKTECKPSEVGCSLNDKGKELFIQGVMGAAANDFNKASSFLKPISQQQENKDASFKDTSSTNENLFPVEPEWEEDDVYLRCRKDAIRMMRAATRHSKAATNSFIRGDHISAQQFSLKAREERVAAQSLNAKAASEILSIRNENNGIWRLDLHGLHASEAAQAVKERLYMIETQMLSEGFSNSFRTKTDGCNHLEIITGLGNHSRGGAALPIAVRTFLADNGYRFDESRPGAIIVRPKFRVS